MPYWIDIQDPNLSKLNQVAVEHHLHPSSVLDCMDPEHYPKIEKIDDTLFMILRFYDHEAKADASDLLSLTRKMSFFKKDNLLITVHRGMPPFLQNLEQQVASNHFKNPSLTLMTMIMKACIESYSPYLEKIEGDIHQLEQDLIKRQMKASDLVLLHQYRGRLAIVKRLLWHTQIMVKEWMTLHVTKMSPWIQDLHETTESHFTYVDEIMQDTNSLMNLHISLSSQKTNEVMRFLTVISLFFLPLTFIVGIYGMNFQFMPELTWHLGYPSVWGLMIVVSLFIYVRVKKRGWLDRTP